VRIHDLRHTHASVGAGAGLGLPIIGKLLGPTTARYAHLDADPLRRASDRIGNHISTAMGDAKPVGVAAANVLQVKPVKAPAPKPNFFWSRFIYRTELSGRLCRTCGHFVQSPPVLASKGGVSPPRALRRSHPLPDLPPSAPSARRALPALGSGC
jgi:hypothetical protein